LKEIVEKLYAQELNLITAKPVMIRVKKVSLVKRFKAASWDKQSVAAKIAMVSFGLLVCTGCIYYYNLFTTESYMVRLEAAQIEAELQRRNDLIPNLTRTVMDYMAYEGKVFVHAADVRSALGPLKEKSPDGTLLPTDAQSIASIKSAISKFQAVAENYPDLKSSVTYQNLMSELANTETRLAIARAKYNSAANLYNTSLELVPGYFFGLLLGFSHATTFIADKADKVPTVVK